jgi:1-acyl-sn-glycerol-3-phosphate acyltransferase
MIRFIWLNGFIGLYSIIVCLWVFIISFFDRDGRLVHRFCAAPWARTILFICGVKLEVSGISDIEKDKPLIYMSNHQSNFDIYALLAGLPVNFKFILKQELMKIPLLGMAMKRAGYISLDREDSRKAIISVNMAADKIRNGASVLIFPEGTRSEDGVVGEFKKGGFHLALKSGCDIVPVAISKSRDIARKGSQRINKGTIYLMIGKAIPTKDCSKRDMDLIMKTVRDAVVGMMQESASEENP